MQMNSPNYPFSPLQDVINMILSTHRNDAINKETTMTTNTNITPEQFQAQIFAELARDRNVPNAWLNAAQRKIIIDWIIGIEEDTALMDGNCTVEDLVELRKIWESRSNPELREEMKHIACGELNDLVRSAR
tara:strand:+ start:12773 stop:13168 length:396 start_codon:yes stop_codon:yes gene_type:complete